MKILWTTVRSWWTESVPSLNALLLAVHHRGGYNCPRCIWWYTIDGRAFGHHLAGRP